MLLIYDKKMDPNTSFKNRSALSRRRDAIKRYIRSVMVLRNLQYRDLCDQLLAHDISITEENLRSKVGKGQIPGDLLTLLFTILGVNDSALQDIERLINDQ